MADWIFWIKKLNHEGREGHEEKALTGPGYLLCFGLFWMALFARLRLLLIIVVMFFATEGTEDKENEKVLPRMNTDLHGFFYHKIMKQMKGSKKVGGFCFWIKKLNHKWTF